MPAPVLHLKGRVLRAGNYMAHGNTTFVFDVRVDSSEGGIPCDEVSRLSIHSSLVEGRPGLAALALIQQGDRLDVRLEGMLKKNHDENYIICDRLRDLQVTYRE